MSGNECLALTKPMRVLCCKAILPVGAEVVVIKRKTRRRVLIAHVHEDGLQYHDVRPGVLKVATS